jgi:hypothetical protein
VSRRDERDMEQRIRDERLQSADVHAQRGRAAAQRLNGPAYERIQREHAAGKGGA